MGFPTKLRELWNKQMWDRKPVKPVSVPLTQDPDYQEKDK